MGRKRRRHRRSTKEKSQDEEEAAAEVSLSSDKVECFSWNPCVASVQINHVDQAPAPVAEGGLINIIFKALQSVGRLHIPAESSPTVIQTQAWPRLMPSLFASNNNNNNNSKNMHQDSPGTTTSLITLSPTGSGKTLAYTVPLVHRALMHEESALVLAPTRELVIQIGKNLKAANKAMRRIPEFKDSSQVKLATIYGGLDKKEQENALTEFGKPGILVSTTGRLLDVLQTSDEVATTDEEAKSRIAKQVTAFLNSISSWVVDEADRMATHSDLSKQIEEILPHLSIDAMRVFASATWPNETQKWKEWIWGRNSNDRDTSAKPCTVIRVNHNAIRAAAKPRSKDPTEDDNKADKTATDAKREVVWSEIPANITQTLHVCAEHKKPRKLLATLQKIKQAETGRQRPLCIVFFATIKMLQYCNKLISKEGIVGLELHSHMPQQIRERNIQTFSGGKATLLLATDICARGVHINHVRTVVQYDFPGNMEQYIHRCGRAGRDGKPATVYSFFTRNLKPLAMDVIQILQKSKSWVDPNLLLLAEDSKPNRAKRPKREHNPKKNSLDSANSDEDSFAALTPTRIALKRSLDVSDASDNDGGDDDDNDL
eukprot:scaffold1369_cov163-Amphora_coffeaeformis.AAC.1